MNQQIIVNAQSITDKEPITNKQWLAPSLVLTYGTI